VNENEKALTKFKSIIDEYNEENSMNEDEKSSEKFWKDIERIIKTAIKVFNWYYVFGEDNSAAREHLAELGNALRDGGYLNQKKEEKDG
jgi:hypothetical protein